VTRRDTDWRPSIPHRSCEFQAVDAAGQVDVREHDANIRMGIQKIDGFISIARFNNIEALFLKRHGDIHAYNDFIFNHEV
jgi:hypothetical protein